MYRFMMPDISVEKIVLASEGDSEALGQIIQKYGTYIRWLSYEDVVDCYGNKRRVYNEELQHRLEAKLIYAIVTGYKILDM